MQIVSGALNDCNVRVIAANTAKSLDQTHGVLPESLVLDCQSQSKYIRANFAVFRAAIACAQGTTCSHLTGTNGLGAALEQAPLLYHTSNCTFSETAIRHKPVGSDIAF